MFHDRYHAVVKLRVTLHKSFPLECIIILLRFSGGNLSYKVTLFLASTQFGSPSLNEIKKKTILKYRWQNAVWDFL